jgi:hypothetical protein
MPYALFHDLFPALAEKETRTIIVPTGLKSPLPAGEYGFCEMFCDEPGCDCRRVFFMVASSRMKGGIAAVIAYGWETSAFYAQWLRSDDPAMIADLTGPVLNLGSPQSPLAPVLLEYFKTVLLHDKAYIARVKCHYAMFRRRIEDK